jgi:hypothetical protein
MTGQIVLQLGGRPPKTTSGDLFAGTGFEGFIDIETANTYTFSVVVDVGPVSMLPRGFTAATSIDFGIFGINGRSETFFPPPRGVIGARYGLRQLAFSEFLQPGKYPFTIAVGALIDYTGSPNPAPYAEMIATYRSAMQVSPGATLRAEEGGLRKSPERNERVIHEMSDREAATEGPIGL